MKKNIVYIVLALGLAILALLALGPWFERDYQVQVHEELDPYHEKVESYEMAKVISIEELGEDQYTGDRMQKAVVQISTGDMKGALVEPAVNILMGESFREVNFQVGDEVMLYIETYSDGRVEYYIADENRVSPMIILVVLFVLALLIVGLKQGFKTILTLLITIFFIFFVEVPLLIAGKNAILVTVLVASLITVNTVTIITGLSKKAMAAILGTLFGVVVAGCISGLVSMNVEMFGVSAFEYNNIVTVMGRNFNFQHLLFAAILLGTLGAVMDVAMSIASSIDALHSVNANLTKKELFRSGMGVGRDIMGTMANTLILAYVGAMLPMIIMFVSQKFSLLRLMNLDQIATEIIRSIAGSIGLVLTIPFTAFIMVMFVKDVKSSPAVTEEES